MIYDIVSRNVVRLGMRLNVGSPSEIPSLCLSSRYVPQAYHHNHYYHVPSDLGHHHYHHNHHDIFPPGGNMTDGNMLVNHLPHRPHDHPHHYVHSDLGFHLNHGHGNFGKPAKNWHSAEHQIMHLTQ